MRVKKQKISGADAESRLMAFLQSGDVMVQRVNEKVGVPLLPEFSMWPTLAATAVLSAVIAWYAWRSCQMLGDVVKQQHKQGSASFQQEMLTNSQMPHAVRSQVSCKARVCTPKMIYQR